MAALGSENAPARREDNKENYYDEQQDEGAGAKGKYCSRNQ